MPLILRKIRSSRWPEVPDRAWVPPGDVPADPLGDLTTSGNKLSVYFIDDADREQVDRQIRRALIALAASADRPDSVDHVLFRHEVLEAVGIDVEAEPGATPDDEVNGWHRNLARLTGSQLVRLANHVLNTGEFGDRLLSKQVFQEIVDGIQGGRIDERKLKQAMREKLGLISHSSE